MKLHKLAISIVATATLAASAMTGAEAAAPSSGETKLYLVQTLGQPVSTYDGSVAGVARTKPDAGQRVNTRGSAAKQWLQKLRGQHDSALKSARVDTRAKVYDYGITFNGFAARLTDAEAERLRRSKDVLQVWEDEIFHADTTTTRDFLGLSGRKGVWETEFRGTSKAGEGVIVGVLDSGIWAETASFAPLSEPRPDGHHRRQVGRQLRHRAGRAGELQQQAHRGTAFPRRGSGQRQPGGVLLGT